MVTTTRVGTIEVVQLNDAMMSLPVTADELFPTVTADAWPALRRRHPGSADGADGWRASVNCHVVRTAALTILVDTGLGSAARSFSGFAGTHGTLPARLEEAGIDPLDIDVVLHTHLHADHVGWNVAPDGSPSFANARYVAHEADWAMSLGRAAAGEPNAAYVEESLLPIERAGVLDLVSEPPVVAPGVSTVHAPGHTPGHLCVRIADGGDVLWLVGDVLAHPLQVAGPEHVYAFDRDRDLAVATRRAVLARIASDHARMAACHIADPGFGRVTGTADGLTWVPEAAPTGAAPTDAAATD